MLTIEEVKKEVRYLEDEIAAAKKVGLTIGVPEDEFKLSVFKLALRVLTLQAQGAKMVMPEATDMVLPCPFCGGEGDLALHEGKTASNHYTAQVVCAGKCDNVCANSGWGLTKEDALRDAKTRWNTRSHTAAPDLLAEGVG